MTYANPVLVHGLTNAISELAAHHAGGLIVPDLSWEESGPWRAACRKAGISLVQMATPATSLARVRVLARGSRGFVYLVSHYGTTGRAGFAPSEELRPIIAAIRDAAPTTPVLLGFGIRKGSDVRASRALGVDGVVVGSAFEELIERGRSPERIRRFLEPFAAGLHRDEAGPEQGQVRDGRVRGRGSGRRRPE
jgi:tryptophan synthase alpha chain